MSNNPVECSKSETGKPFWIFPWLKSFACNDLKHPAWSWYCQEFAEDLKPQVGYLIMTINQVIAQCHTKQNFHPTGEEAKSREPGNSGYLRRFKLVNLWFEGRYPSWNIVTARVIGNHNGYKLPAQRPHFQPSEISRPPKKPRFGSVSSEIEEIIPEQTI
jgi:hypothetical protein